ncbi:MAG: hypothetical protein IH849_09470 [Acidobacteria bacterium]|nr:hypothetical protein [Acidobacteriota bacterium]
MVEELKFVGIKAVTAANNHAAISEVTQIVRLPSNSAPITVAVVAGDANERQGLVTVHERGARHIRHTGPIHQPL